MKHLTGEERIKLDRLVDTCHIKHIDPIFATELAETLSDTRAALQIATEELHQVNKEMTEAELIQSLLEKIAVLTRRTTEAEAERDRLREALETVEWLGFICPWCRRLERKGHAPDCQRQAALGLTEEE